MPITKSAKKALRVAVRRKEENNLTRARLKSAVKGLKIAARNQEKKLEQKLRLAFREIDLAAKKNIIHKNKANRLKSNLSQRLANAEKK